MDLPPPSIFGRMSGVALGSLVIVAEITGLTAVVLMGVWLGHFTFGGMSWTSMGKMNTHPFVMTLGMVFIFGTATISYRVLGRFAIPRKAVKTLHGVMMLVVMACTALGIYLAVSSYVGKKLNTIHAMMGIITVVIFVLQFLVAFSIFVLPVAPNWLRALYLKLHAYFGILALVSAAATCLSGLQAGSYFFGAKPDLYLSAAVCIIVFTATIAYILTNDSLRAKKEEPVNNILPNNNA